ncbi:UNVERIFIED_CONTAM: hypothetical protein FKN15_043226 [Acipenser sinensis]
MGCVMCSPLLEMWNVSTKQPGSNCLELSIFPESCVHGYQRVSGLHYVSSFSDAEDCCDDVSPNSPSLTDASDTEE